MATKTLLTVDQFAELPDDGNRIELDRGELVSMSAPKPRHSQVAKRIFIELLRAAEDSGSGEVFSEMAFRLGADTVCAPDVSVVTASVARTIRPDEYVHGTPLLAVEVVSPSETAEDLEQKGGAVPRRGGEICMAGLPEIRERARTCGRRRLQNRDSRRRTDNPRFHACRFPSGLAPFRLIRSTRATALIACRTRPSRHNASQCSTLLE